MGIGSGGKGGKGGDGGSSFPSDYDDFVKLIRSQLFDVNTPAGSRRFLGLPGSPYFRAEITLPEEEQALLEQQRRFRGQLAGLAASQLSGGGARILGMPIGPQNFADAAGEVERATFERAQNLLQPTFEEQQRRQENQLIQRGLPRSGEAFTTESDRLARQQNEALENLALSSVQAGRQEQSRLLQSELARRQGMLGEIGVLGLGQPVQMPGIPVGQADATGAAGLVANTQAQRNALRAQQAAAGKGGLTSLLGLGAYGLGTAYGGPGAGKAAGAAFGPVIGATGPSTFGEMFV